VSRTGILLLASALIIIGALGSYSQESAHPLRFAGLRDTHRPEVPGVHGLVTAGHPLASMAGLRILMEGGKAIDASVAILATLNVVSPQMSGAAGNGFMTFFDKSTGKVHSLGATGAAPRELQAEKLTPDELNKGIQAGVVPGLFGGWIAALDRFGTMSLAQVMERAIDYAANGHPLEASVARSIGAQREIFETFPASARMFLPGTVKLRPCLAQWPDEQQASQLPRISISARDHQPRRLALPPLLSQL
jgi:gamma-glutamyltranspeptidase/glutathione hydrolase